jgi:polyisoprenoid-binding protein YceI
MVVAHFASRIGLAQTVTAGIVGLALLQAGPAYAQSVDFSVSGTSTVRGWTCTVTGSAQVTAGSSAPVRGLADGIQAATLTVPVREFDCPQDEMIEHLLEALRADEFPEITFLLEGYRPSGQGAITTGTLTILDSTQEVSFPLFLTPSGSGVQLQGELALDMTAYGVEPPVVMLGLMRVRPQIRIQFSGTIAP